MAYPKVPANVVSFFKAATQEQQLAVKTAQENFEQETFETSVKLLKISGMFGTSLQHAAQLAQAPTLSVVPKSPR